MGSGLPLNQIGKKLHSSQKNQWRPFAIHSGFKMNKEVTFEAWETFFLYRKPQSKYCGEPSTFPNIKSFGLVRDSNPRTPASC